MQKYELRDQGADYGEALLAFAESFNLECKETTLRSLPPNLHWHLRKPLEKGTLEITWLRETGETWIAVHSNRMGDWIPAVITELQRRFG